MILSTALPSSTVASGSGRLSALRRIPLSQAAGSELATDRVSLSSAGPAGASDAPAAPDGAVTASLAASAMAAAQQAAQAAVPGPTATVLKVLTLNTYFDARAGVDKMVDLIRRTGADLVGLQEVNTTTRKLAEKLGMHYLQQDKRTALLSRFPIESVTPKKYGVAVTLENGRKVGFLNAHTTSFPNQSHQLLHLPIGGGPYLDTEKQAVWWADKTRGREFRSIISEADGLGLPAIATGDFNEASHLDWTERTAAIKRHPIKVEWPGSKALEKAGFKDSYRVKYPDEVAHPGNTWTPTTADDDPKDHHDRIDFVMYRGPELELKDVQIVGENSKNADIVIDPYPTDHRAVLATFEVH
jgi:endonuclease/exonuclease/phosphatase family metal-dependent hydrolase